MKLRTFANTKSRKGISSIIGGIFFLVLMTAGFTVYYVALDSQSQMLDTQKIIADSEIAKIQEDFVVAASSNPADNRLSLQVANIGNNPIEIADIWIINKTDAGEPAERHDLNYADVSIPVGHTGNILENTALYLNPEVYDIKVISSIGTIKTIEFDVNGGSNILKAQMVAIPQDVRFGENVTVTLIVTNVGTEPIQQVTANKDSDLGVSPNQCRDPPNGIFLGPTDLLPSQSTMFFWDCVLDPPIGNTITFTGNATGQLQGADIDSNDATDSVIVRDFTSGSGDELILKDELFGKPEIFMIIPNTFGDQDADAERGFWGINIVNPTNKTMTVSKISISALRANANDNHVIFDGGCPMDMISPTSGWSCPNENVITWKNIATPISVERQSAYSFLVKVKPGALVGSGVGLETIVTTTSALTSLGAFGKGPYETSMKRTDDAIANVYLSSSGDSISGGDIRGVIMGISSGATVKFNATMAELSNSGEAIVGGGSNPARLIINIPKEWKSPSVTDSSGFTVDPITVFPDESTQIVGSLNSNLSNGAKYIEFQITAPANTGFNGKMYVFHILASGITTGGYTIGPIHEAVVQVCPTNGGPLTCP